MASTINAGTMELSKALLAYNETQGERDFRDRASFPDLESTMSFPLLSRRHTSMLDMASSFLGSWNPFLKPADRKDHEVWLLDNTAYKVSKDAPWQAKFTAAYFKKDTGVAKSEAISTIAHILGIDDKDPARDIIAQRLEPFLTTILPAHHATINVCGKGKKRLSPSNHSGISYDTFQIAGNYKDGDTCDSTVTNVAKSIPCTTTFAETSGWAVISDVDDTIKITGSGDPKEVLKNTFIEDPKVVPGMPELYAWLQKELDNPPFWYLSASPYVLYPFLRDFRKTNYPDGTMQLRETSITNIAALLMSLSAGVQEFKTSHIEPIQTNFPKRKVFCFGDSTQSDPEAYAEIYKRHPGWVAGIFIRKVEGQPILDITGKNADSRFEKAFEGIPSEDWLVFTDPNVCYERIEELKRRKSGR